MTPRFAPAIDVLDNAIRHSVHFREWLRARRWCGDSIGARAEVSVKERAVLAESGSEAIVLFLAVAKLPEGQVIVHLPLSLAAARPQPDAFELQAGSERLFVSEAERGEPYAKFLVDGFHGQAKLPTSSGDGLYFSGGDLGSLQGGAPVLVGDSSNLVVRFATSKDEVVFKSYKIPDVRNREPEILERLHKRQFRHVPRFLGELALGRGPDRLVLGLATERVEGPDLFTWFTAGWRAELGGGEPLATDVDRERLDVAGALGDATAALHEALLEGHAGPFQAETFTADDATAARRAAITNLGDSLRRLAALAQGPDRRLADLARMARTFLFENRPRIEAVLQGLNANVRTAKSVTHGDLHLGQVLRRAADGSLYFIDFEGEPERAPGQRAVKWPPLRDVGTMNRSFSYVKHYAWRDFIRGDATAALQVLEREKLEGTEGAVAQRLVNWETAAMEGFSQRYLRSTSLYPGLAAEDALKAIRGWMMEKALYEFRYELKHRPVNIFIPLEGIVALATGGGPMRVVSA